MGIYRFVEQSPIREIRMLGEPPTPWGVYLIADDKTPPEKLASLQDTLLHKGFHTAPVSIDGKPALQVTGPEQGGNLFGTLRAGKLLEGRAQYEPSNKERELSKQGTTKRIFHHIREKSLRYTGVFYFTGAMSLLVSGLVAGRPKEAFSGLLYSITDPLLMVYGHPTVKQQMKHLSERVIHRIRADGIHMPEDSQLYCTSKKLKDGTLHTINNFLFAHPSEIACTVNGLAAFQMFRSGKEIIGTPKELLEHKEVNKTYDPVYNPYTGPLTTPPLEHAKEGVKNIFRDRAKAKQSFAAAKEQFKAGVTPEGKKELNKFNAGLWDMIGGAANSSSAIISMLIPEKKDNPEDKNKKSKPHSPSGLWGWIREKPLRLVGYVYSLITLTYIKSALAEMRANPATKAWRFKLFTGASFLAADLLLASSSKSAEHRGNVGDEGARDMAAQVAEVIAAQPAEEQGKLVQRMANFLAGQPEIIKNSDAMATLIQEQLDVRKTNPWLLAKMPVAIANDNAAQHTAVSQAPAIEPSRPQASAADRNLKDSPSARRGGRDQFANRFPSSSGHKGRVEEAKQKSASAESGGPSIS